LEHHSFGRVTVDGHQHTRDLIVLPDRVVFDWWREGHALAIEDLDAVLDELPERLVLGVGAHGRLRPDPTASRSSSAPREAVERLPTDAAVRRYGEHDERRTAAALHPDLLSAHGRLRGAAPPHRQRRRCADRGRGARRARPGARVDRAYELLVSGGAQRATQTLACFACMLREPVAGGVGVEAGLRSRVEDRWRAAYQQAGSGDLAALRSADPELVGEDSATLADALRRVLERVSEGGGRSPSATARPSRRRCWASPARSSSRSPRATGCSWSPRARRRTRAPRLIAARSGGKHPATSLTAAYAPMRTAAIAPHG
jgi:hypothetical protein